VPVLAEADVLVCGGGCAGVVAAIAAARRGCRVVLLERWTGVGGMLTNALVTIWHRSDRRRVVINGLVEEMTQRALRHGWARPVGDFPRRHETHWLNPEGLRLLLQRMLDEAGVRTICHLVAGQPILEGGRLRGVLCDTKRGRRAVLGRIAIDATGDGDIAAACGVPFTYGRESDGRAQGMTMMFELCGIDTAALRAAPVEVRQAVIDHMRTERDAGRFPPFNEGGVVGQFLKGWASNHAPWNLCPVAGDGLDEEELTRLTHRAREQVARYLECWRERLPGMAAARLSQTAYALGVRETRHVRGRVTLTASMVLAAAKQPDAVGHGVWMIDVHDPLGTGYTTYTDRDARSMLAEGTSYHIPLGMALNVHVPNLAVACRAADATHEAHASFRVQTHLMALAQGVGTCAALAMQSGCDLAEVPVASVQHALRDDGVHLEDVPAPGGA